jgi:hypothetical protein
MYANSHNNIILHQLRVDDGSISFMEVLPSFDASLIAERILSIDISGNLCWSVPPIIPEMEKMGIIEDDRIRDTSIFYENGRIGISRSPLFNYKFDIAVPQNTLLTAFHIGDGEYGFSMGNGTSQGFIPEIIGMGSDENDAGLYLLGKSGNNNPSDIPLVIIDGRNSSHEELSNRPILGITSGNYNSYKVIVDHEGKLGLGKIPQIYRMEVNGSVEADDFIIDKLSVKALIYEVRELQKEIDILKDIMEQR